MKKAEMHINVLKETLKRKPLQKPRRKLENNSEIPLKIQDV
jgi:hypothetical protein